MKMLREFEEFLKMKVVIKQSPDIERSKSLIAGSEKKLSFLKK